MENFSSDLLFIIIVLVGAAFLGYLIGYFVNARYKKVNAAVDDMKKDIDDLKVRISDLAGHLEKHHSEHDALKEDLAVYREKHKSEYESLKSDLENYMDKHTMEYEGLKSDLATEREKTRELQKLASEMEGLKKKINDHSHELIAEELNYIKSKLTEIDDRTAPAI